MVLHDDHAPEMPNAAGERLLRRVQELRPAITPRLGEITAGRRIPLDIVAALRTAGIYRAYAPRALGGLELSPAEVFRAVTALSRIDGSVGWTAMLGTSAQLLLTLLPPDGYAALFRDGPDVVFTGSDQPCGTARRNGSSAWQVEGRWPFASGCLHAEWIGSLSAVVDASTTDGGAQRSLRFFVAPAASWTIEDTWDVIGLEGTGSHHIVLPPTTIEDHFSFALTDTTRTRRTEPAFQGPFRWLPLAHAACQLGIAAGALDDLLASVAGGHRRQGRPSTTRDSEVAQSEIGRLAIAHRAAQALHDDIVGEQWRATLAGDADDPALLPEAEAAATWIAATCREVASGCFSLAGIAAIGKHATLGRRWRDLQVAGQHIKVRPANYIGLGRQHVDA
jgi:indole-3-acetate monooxygenase